MGDSAAGDDRQAEVQELTAQLARMTDIAGRAQADLQNAKIRMQRDGDEIRQFAAERFLLKLIPTIENFQRAFTHLPHELKAHEWVKGVGAIEQDLIRQLSEMGLRKMECLGQPVDTARHDVLTIGPGEEGIIIEILENGYELHGKVLRPAKVKVGDGSVSGSQAG